MKRKTNKYSLKHDPESSYNEKVVFGYLLDSSRSMITIIDNNYTYVKVNSTFCTAHKLDSVSIVGNHIGQIWGDNVFENKIKQKIDLCFLGKTVRYEACFETPSAGKKYFEVVFRPVNTGSGLTTHIIAETFDISELVLSRKSIREKEEELRILETNLPIGFLRCDPDGKIIHANSTFRKIMECQNDIANSHQNLKDFYIDESIFEMQVEQLSKCNTNTFGRVYLKNCKGIEIPCRVSGFLALNESGYPSFIDFAIEDSSRELILENRLLQAQKLETIGALAGGIAHDFNNILATISGYSEMLQDDLSRDSLLSEKVARIQVAVTKAQSITNQMLTFSRHVEQEKIPVSVGEVLKETIGFINSSIPPDVVVKSSIQKNNEIVFADPTQLFRVFLNLMTNALQSFEGNGGTISVQMTVVEGKYLKHELNKDIVADEYALITFKDNGRGMDQSLVTRVFEPFFTTREVGKGTGLGLSVVHGIISELEGEILVSSKKQVGTTFYVYLPISKAYQEISVQNNKRKRILFITGNKYESRILSLALKNTGYELIYTSDSKKLLKVMMDISERPDLIIYMSDSRQIVPDDLLAIFNRIKISTPCILITESTHELLEEKLLNSGIIKQHLYKPVSLKEIRNAIQQSITQ